ncbi:MAG: hypothetical protein ABJN65_08110 [Parasphingorhabdus sp.]
MVEISKPEELHNNSKRRDKRIAIGSQTRLTGEHLMEAERGFDLDGNQLWGTPTDQFTTLVRVN